MLGWEGRERERDREREKSKPQGDGSRQESAPLQNIVTAKVLARLIPILCAHQAQSVCMARPSPRLVISAKKKG